MKPAVRIAAVVLLYLAAGAVAFAAGVGFVILFVVASSALQEAWRLWLWSAKQALLEWLKSGEAVRCFAAVLVAGVLVYWGVRARAPQVEPVTCIPAGLETKEGGSSFARTLLLVLCLATCLLVLVAVFYWALFPELGHISGAAEAPPIEQKLVRTGESLRVVSARLGHSGTGITADYYAHLFLDAQKETARKVDTLLADKLT